MLRFRRTEFKELTAHFQFGADYPASPLIVELKSKPLDFKLLQGLEKVCTEEAQKYLNKQQVSLHTGAWARIRGSILNHHPYIIHINRQLFFAPLFWAIIQVDRSVYSF